MKITNLVARCLSLVALTLFTSTAHAGPRIRCSGPDCETLRIDCRGTVACYAGIHADDGPSYNVFFTRHALAFDEIVVLERFTNVVIRTGSGDDSVSFIDVHIPGKLAVYTGGGDDTVGGEDSGASTMRIDTGGGNDSFFSDGGLGSRSSIRMGAGDDYLSHGAGYGTPLLMDGGGGNDTINAFVDPSLPAPTIKNFETIIDIN